jgi:hypothetical protein
MKTKQPNKNTSPLKIKPRKNENLSDYSARFLAIMCNKDASTKGSSSITIYTN